MTLLTTLRGAALGLLLAGEAAAGTSRPPQAAGSPETAQPRPSPTPRTRLYTNEDLDRIHPYAGQTGGGSASVAGEAEGDGDNREESERRGRSQPRGEEYWRAEAARTAERVRGLEERAADLRRRIAEQAEKARRERQSEVFGRRRGATGPAPQRVTSLQASLEAVERRIRKLQDDLEERARRDSALPGWLR